MLYHWLLPVALSENLPETDKLGLKCSQKAKEEKIYIFANKGLFLPVAGDPCRLGISLPSALRLETGPGNKMWNGLSIVLVVLKMLETWDWTSLLSGMPILEKPI